MLSKKLAIDLGSSRTRIYVKNKRVVVDEPSLVARDHEDYSTIAIGEEAWEKYSKLSDDTELVRPIVSGVIADFSNSEKMLKYFIQKSTGRVHVSKPEAMVTFPSGATSTEQKAILDVGRHSGLSNVYLIPGGLAAALGAGLPIIEPRGFMVIDIGAETTEVSVSSLGGIVASNFLRVGGRSITESIQKYLKRDFGIIVGFNTAEETKRLVGSLIDQNQKKTIKISGKTTSESRLKTIEISPADIHTYIESVIEKIILSIRVVLEKTPPDLVADIANFGVSLTGGGAQLDGLEKYLEQKINAKCKLAQDPMLCSVKGAHLALSHLEDYKRSLIGL